MVALEITLPPDTESPGRARSFVRQALADEPGDITDMVLLLVSEVVTNAVLHARSQIRLGIGWNGDAVRVEVADHSPLPATPRRFAELATTGRGMQMVDQVADSWGLRPVDDGKVIWFELTMSRRDG